MAPADARVMVPVGSAVVAQITRSGFIATAVARFGRQSAVGQSNDDKRPAGCGRLAVHTLKTEAKCAVEGAPR